MDNGNLLLKQAQAAHQASRELAAASTIQKNKTLLKMADMLEKETPTILKENNIDLENGRRKKLSTAMLDRLMLNEMRIHTMAEGLREIASLDDPIGEGIVETVRPNGLDIRAIRVPLGVVGIIYEARPNVTSDSIGLCLKSGNAVILRGGSEAIHSNTIISNILMRTAYQEGIPEGAIQFVNSTDRKAVHDMLQLRDYIDVVIPRGGAGLINFVLANSTVPVIETGAGICHAFVDSFADFDIATKIVINAKTSRPAVCNTIETLLVHKDIAPTFLPHIIAELQKHHVEVRGCQRVLELCPEFTDLVPATEQDWATEYHDLIISIKVVDSLADAVNHINTFNTRHSEVIVTNNYTNAHYFQKYVDAAVIYVNASTRFTDGYEFGFGAEIGISTQKLHVRGPMGLHALTTMKYMVDGNGQIRI